MESAADASFSDGSATASPSALSVELELTTEQVRAVRDQGRGEYGCRHYRRRVRFITPCCNEEWWCRHCHNEVKYQQENVSSLSVF